MVLYTLFYRKSPRERIIPIAVEGEGIVTPPPHVEEAAELGAARAHQAFSRTLSGRPTSLKYDIPPFHYNVQLSLYTCVIFKRYDYSCKVNYF